MLLTEYNEKKTMDLMFHDGAEQRQHTLNNLFLLMRRDGRIEEYAQAAEDDVLMETIIKEYGLK